MGLRDRLRDIRENKLSLRPKRLGLAAAESDPALSPASSRGGTEEAALDSSTSTKHEIPPRHHSLWQIAWEKACDEHADEINSLKDRIAELTTKRDQSPVTGEQIADEISAAYHKHQLEHETSHQIKEVFSQILSLVQKGSQIIGAAANANPIAAAVWTGVSLAIPILLLPSNQNKAAVETLKESVELLRCYYSYEQVLLDEDGNESVRAAREKIVELYLLILLFEARLIKHREQSGARRLVNDLTKDWSETLTQMKRIDANFKSQMEALRAIWQREEQKRRKKQEDHQGTNGIITALYVDFVPPKAKRLPGTCEWFLRRPEFISWKMQSAGLLWVTADPGCGKSVLIKYLVESRVELLYNRKRDVILASFFFYGGRALSNTATALCSLLNQILVGAPQYASVVQTYCETKGMSPRDLRTSDSRKIWEVLLKVVEVVSKDKEVICILDALDECDASLETLLEVLDELYSDAGREDLPLKFLITSRPYQELRRGLRRTTNIQPSVRIDATEEQDAIKEEIDIVIHQKVGDLTEEKDLDTTSRKKLLSALQSAEHKTYLWLYLVLERFRVEWTHAGHDIQDFVGNLPQSVEEEYDKILDRMSPANRDGARAILAIILVAFRPLTALEAYQASRMNNSVRSVEELSTGTNRPVSEVVRDICGLFVTVDREDRLYLIHQTARDFLIQESKENFSEGMAVLSSDLAKTQWGHTFSLPECHLRLGAACLRYMFLDEVQNHGLDEEDSHECYEGETNYYPLADKLGFYIHLTELCYELQSTCSLIEYAPNFLYHFKCIEVPIPNDLCKLIDDLECQRYGLFFDDFGQRLRAGYSPPYRSNANSLAATMGLTTVLKYFRSHRAVDFFQTHWDSSNDSKSLTFPINEAIGAGHYETVQFLLEEQSLPSDHTIFEELSMESNIINPLGVAASFDKKMFALLRSRPEFSIEVADRNYKPLLFCAIDSNDIEIVRDVLRLGADPTALFLGETALAYAVHWEYPRGKDSAYTADFLKVIIQAWPSALNIVNHNGASPLYHSLKQNAEWLTSWLLEQGALYTTSNQEGRNMMHAFVRDDVITSRKCPSLRTFPEADLHKLLKSQDKEGNTPLLLAVKERCWMLAYEFLKLPVAQLGIADNDGLTPVQLMQNAENNFNTYPSFLKMRDLLTRKAKEEGEGLGEDMYFATSDSSDTDEIVTSTKSYSS